MAGSLEHKLVFDLLTAEVGNADCLQVGLQGALILSLFVKSVADLDVAFQPRVLKCDHLLKSRYSSTDIASLNADFSHTAQVVEVLLVFDALDAALSEV